MLQWNELRITEDSKHLVIDVQVQNLDYYENVHLQSLYMNVYNKSSDYVAPMPDSKSILLWQYEPPQEVTEEEEHKPKHIRKFIDIDGLSENLFFVYAIADGEATDDTPCGCKNHVLMGVVYNNQALYRNSINAISTTSTCAPNQELIDYILNVKLFEFSLKAGDYRAAIDFWNTTFKNNDKTSKKSCGCHGY